MRYEDVPWEAAACKGTDPESFYPPNGIPVKTVIRICQGCPILAECGEYAIEHETHGYWAGMAEHVRYELKVQRNRRRWRANSAAKNKRDQKDNSPA